jgi:hypothetical protein
VDPNIATFYNNKISFLANLWEYFKDKGTYRSANEYRDDERVVFDYGDAKIEISVNEETKTESVID